MKHIIHLSISPLTSGLANGLIIPQCLEAGYQVLYLDLAHLIGLRTNRHDDSYKNIIVTIQDRAQLHLMLQRFNRTDTILNVQIGYDRKTSDLIGEMYSLPFTTIFFDMGNLPTTRLKRITSKIRNALIPSKVRPDYVFQTGGFSPLNVANKSTKYFINYVDYDNALANRQAKPNKNLAVFLDQYTPFHPDYDLLGGIQIDALQYYMSIRDFLLRVQAEFGLEPVIALHPKATLDFLDWKGIRLAKNQTNDVCSEAKIIFTHFSTSASYAVIYECPLVLLVNKAIETSNQKEFILKNARNFSRYLKSPILNCDEETLKSKHFKINSAHYHEYLYSYLTTPASKDKTSKQIVLEKLELIFRNLASSEGMLQG